MASAPPPPTDDIAARTENLFLQREINPFFRDRLLTHIPKAKVVILCDDSSSMNLALPMPGADPFAPSLNTRWLELKKYASEIISVVTALNPNGVDLYFLHREKLLGVTSPAGLQAKFAEAPKCATTPLVATLEYVYNETVPFLEKGQKLLIVCLCDGEPSGGPCETRDGIKQILKNITASRQVHVAFAEMTSQEDDCAFLDGLDTQIPNFDNSDFYEYECARVKNIQGAQFKFNTWDYTCKILLGTFDPWCFALDQYKVADVRIGTSLIVPAIPSSTNTTTSVLPPSYYTTVGAPPPSTSQFSPPRPVSYTTPITFTTPPPVIPTQNGCCIVS